MRESYRKKCCTILKKSQDFVRKYVVHGIPCIFWQLESLFVKELFFSVCYFKGFAALCTANSLIDHIPLFYTFFAYFISVDTSDIFLIICVNHLASSFCAMIDFTFFQATLANALFCLLFINLIAAKFSADMGGFGIFLQPGRKNIKGHGILAY